MPKQPTPCMERGCDLPRRAPARRCIWHHLAREPIDDQVTEAMRRLSMVPDELRIARVPAKEWPEGERFCASCQSFVPLHYARGSRCIACASLASHAAMILKTYGITAIEYRRLLDLQGGKCAGCRTRPKSRRLAVDHDHKSGEVRGLLCGPCNHDALGAARESPFILRSLAHYLDNPPASGRWTPPEALPAPAPADDLLDPGDGRPAPVASPWQPGTPEEKLRAAGLSMLELMELFRAGSAAAPF